MSHVHHEKSLISPDVPSRCRRDARSSVYRRDGSCALSGTEGNTAIRIHLHREWRDSEPMESGDAWRVIGIATYAETSRGGEGSAECHQWSRTPSGRHVR